MALHGQARGEAEAVGIRYLVQRCAYDARLEEVTPHTLRHAFGKNLVDAGAPLDRVASLLGHESVDTTRIYTTPSGQDLQREVDTVAMVQGERWYQTPQEQERDSRVRSDRRHSALI